MRPFSFKKSLMLNHILYYTDLFLLKIKCVYPLAKFRKYGKIVINLIENFKKSYNNNMVK